MQPSNSTLRSVIILVVLIAVPGLAEAGIAGFGDFSNFTVNKSTTDFSASPTVFPGKIELTNNGTAENRSIFYNTPQSISSFSASFTYQEVNGNSDTAQGATFVVQNTLQGVHAVGGGLAGFGYEALSGGDPHSAAVSLELTNPTGTALYNGGNIMPGGANHTSPVNLLSGNPIHVSLSYNGTVLNETLLDTVTNAQIGFSYLINLTHVIGSSTAYVGFTAETDFSPDQQYFSDFQFNAVPEPTSLVLLCIGATLFVASRYRRRGK